MAEVTLYALIDVEGHEVSVIQGMKLEKHKVGTPSPCSNTSSGARGRMPAAARPTGHKLIWRRTCRLNYRLYFIGHMRRRATINEPFLPELVLLPVMPEDVYARDSDWHCTSYSDDGVHARRIATTRSPMLSPVLEGNMLAVHRNAMRRRPWLARLIDGLTIATN